MSCQSCLLLVLTFPSWYKCFQIKTVRLLMGKVFLMAVSLLSFHERFLSFFSVDPFSVLSQFLNQQQICFCCFQKKWDMYQPAIDFMKRGLKYYSSKQCLSFWDILRWLNSLFGRGIPMRWSCSFPQKLYREKSKNNCWEEIHKLKWQRPITLSFSQKNCTADLGTRVMCLRRGVRSDAQ